MKNTQYALLSFVLGSSLILGRTLPVQAQVGSQSDVTGAITTTSDIAGGAFAPNGGTVIRSFTTPAITSAVNQAAVILNTQLQSGTLAVANNSISTSVISANLQQSLQNLLTETGNFAAVSRQFENVLISTSEVKGTTENIELVRNLNTKLQGLIADGRVAVPELVAAVEAYNAVIDNSSGEFLTNPPPELVAIRESLSKLVNATLKAQEQEK